MLFTAGGLLVSTEIIENFNKLFLHKLIYYHHQKAVQFFIFIFIFVLLFTVLNILFLLLYGELYSLSKFLIKYALNLIFV